MGRQDSYFHQLTIALHGLLGCQDERCETGEGFRQLQKWMLKNMWTWNENITGLKHKQSKTLKSSKRSQELETFVTCRSSLPLPLFSTSISRHRFRKSLKIGDSFSGFWSSGVPFVAIRYNACQRGRDKQTKTLKQSFGKQHTWRKWIKSNWLSGKCATKVNAAQLSISAWGYSNPHEHIPHKK